MDSNKKGSYQNVEDVLPHGSAPPASNFANRPDLSSGPKKSKESSKARRLSNIFHKQHPQKSFPEVKTKESDIVKKINKKPVLQEQQPGQSAVLANEQDQGPSISKAQDRKRLSFFRKSKDETPARSNTISQRQDHKRVSASPAVQLNNDGAHPRAKHLESIRLLEKNKFSVGRPGFQPDKALIWAAENGHREVVRFLVTDCSIKDEFTKMDALCGAAKAGHTSIIDVFLSLGFINPRQKYCYFKTDPLHEVVKYGNEASVQKVIDAGADLANLCQRGQTALHEAAFHGNVEAVPVLLRQKASLNVLDSKGETALHLAATQGHTAVVKMLLESGIDVDCQSCSGSTALHLATQNNHQKIVALLLCERPDINVPDDLGKTPLHYAVRNRHEGISQVLKNNGARSSQEILLPSPREQALTMARELSLPSPSGRALTMFNNFEGGKDFSWNPDTGLEVRRKIPEKNYASDFDYEPGYVDWRY